MRKTTILSSILMVSLFFSGCNNDNKSKVQEIKTMPIQKVKPKTEFTLTDLNGVNYKIKKTKDGFSLENAKGKVVILDIFATWCPPCRAATTHLSALKAKYKDDLVVIGITVENPISNDLLKEFKNKYKINYILVNSPENQTLIKAVSSSLKIGKQFPIPLMAIYKDGKLIQKYIGSVEEEFVDSDIKRALGK